MNNQPVPTNYRNGPERTGMDQNGQEWTGMDRNGHEMKTFKRYQDTESYQCMHHRLFPYKTSFFYVRVIIHKNKDVINAHTTI